MDGLCGLALIGPESKSGIDRKNILCGFSGMDGWMIGVYMSTLAAIAAIAGSRGQEKGSEEIRGR